MVGIVVAILHCYIYTIYIYIYIVVLLIIISIIISSIIIMGNIFQKLLDTFYTKDLEVVETLLHEFINRTGKSIERSKIDSNYLKTTVVNMSNADSQESLGNNVNNNSIQIQKNVEEIKNKLYKIFENPHEADLRVLREGRIDKRRKLKLDERIEQLKPRREIIRRYVENEKKKILETTAIKMKLIGE